MGNKLDGNDLNRFLSTAGGPTPKTGNDLEGNPLLPSPGETIDSPWGQATVERLIPRYSTAAVRDATVLDPAEGQVCYVVEVDQMQIWDGAEWVEVPDRSVIDGLLALYLPLTGGTLTGHLDGVGAVFTDNVYADTFTVTGTFIHFPSATDAAVIRKNSTNMIQMNDENTIDFVRRITVGGVLIHEVEGGFASTQIYDKTTGSAANVTVVNANGLLERSTSARRYKTDIEDADDLADLELHPVRFLHIGDGRNYLGFIADDIAEQDELAAVYNDDGEVENYDLRAVVAILAAKVNRLEQQVAALEA